MENPTPEGASTQEIEDVEDVPTTQDENTEVDTEIDTEVSTEVDVEKEDEASQDDVAKADEPQIELSHLAQYLDIEEDRLSVNEDGSVEFKNKIDGQEGKAKFKELLANYQIRGHLDNQNREVVEIKKSLQSKLDDVDRQASERLETLDNMSKLAYSELISEDQSINWNELRQEDPAEFAAKQTEFNQRNQKIQQAMELANQERQTFQAEASTKAQQVINDEAVKLQNAIPEWSDEKVASKEKSELSNYLKGLGYTDSEIGNAQDHRVVIAFRKAKMYDELQKSKPDLKKRIKPAPKISKPGQPVKKQEEKAVEDVFYD